MLYVCRKDDSSSRRNDVCRIALAALLVLLVLVVAMEMPTSNAWTTTTTTTTTTASTTSRTRSWIRQSNRKYTHLTAKPPPAASFDLEAIEAFEAQLDEMEAIQANDNGDLYDDDDYDYDDDSSSSTQQQQEEIKTFTIDAATNGKRIDAAIVAAFPEMSRSFCGSLVTNGQVYLVSSNTDNQEKEVINRKSFKVETGQTIQVCFHGKTNQVTEIVAQDIPLDILYEDEYMVVLNKAAHMVVHPAAGNWDGTVVNALAYYLAHVSPYGKGDFVATTTTQGEKTKLQQSTLAKEKDIFNVEGTDGESVNFRPGVVHRLDKGTTGVLVVAKTARALAELSASFAGRKVKKTYLAVAVGNPGKRVVIDKPIGRHPIHRQRMRVVPNPHRGSNSNIVASDDSDTPPTSQTGRRALSYVDTIAFDGRLSLVKVRIETGRTHQIRVHLSDRRTPIYGDDVYGLADWNRKKQRSKEKIERPLLHAYRLEINHPISGEHLAFEAPLPDDMHRMAKAISAASREESKQEVDTMSFFDEDNN